MKIKKIKVLLAFMLTTLLIAGCSSANSSASISSDESTETNTNPITDSVADATQSDTTATEESDSLTTDISADSSTYAGSALDTSDIFSNRDEEQTVDTTEAEAISLISGEDITLTEEGTYIFSGDVTEVTIIVDAEDSDKVQIVLDGVTITNTDAPAIYVKTADKVFVTTTENENTLAVTGSYAGEDTSLDAVIFSKSDLTLNGVGSLSIQSAEGNGISSKDDLIMTGGTYFVTAAEDGLEVHDLIGIKGSDITIEAGADAIHSENSEDDILGSVYIGGGSLTIEAGDDGIRGTSIVQIDDGTIDISSSVEGIEGTYIQINGGTIDLYATDDGINATEKSASYSALIEVNGGDITVEVASGDTDAFDANGSIIINDGIITVTAGSAFDFDVTGELNGGTVTVNGVVITELTGSSFGGKGTMGGSRQVR